MGQLASTRGTKLPPGAKEPAKKCAWIGYKCDKINHLVFRPWKWLFETVFEFI